MEKNVKREEDEKGGITMKVELSTEKDKLILGNVICFKIICNEKICSSTFKNIKTIVIEKETSKMTVFDEDYCSLNSDGHEFQLGFHPRVAGMHILKVFMKGVHINGSPLMIFIELPKPSIEIQTAALSQCISNMSLYEENVPKYSLGHSLLPKSEGYKGTVGRNDLRRPFSNPEKKTALDFMALLDSAGHLKLECLKSVPRTLLQGSIGACELQDHNIIACETMSRPYRVKMIDPQMQLIKQIVPQVAFNKPAAALALKNGDFAVIDENRIHGFSSDGTSKWVFNLPENARHYGIAEDLDGKLVTIQEKKGQGINKTVLICISLKSMKVEESISVFKDTQVPSSSKCRFLSFSEGSFYVTDLGMDKLYVINDRSEKFSCGQSGSRDECFSDPAGTAIDDCGNIIIADSKNHKLALYNRDLQFVCKLELSPPTRRPSDICLSSDKTSLLVLNLHKEPSLAVYDLVQSASKMRK